MPQPRRERERRPNQSPRTSRPPPQRLSDHHRQQQQQHPPREDPADEDDERPKKKRPPDVQKRAAQESPKVGKPRTSEKKHKSVSSSERSSNALNFDTLAKLDAFNDKAALITREKERHKEKQRERERERERKLKDRGARGRVPKERNKEKKDQRRRSEKSELKEKRRVISGPLAEEGKIGRRRADGYVRSEAEDDDDDGRSRRKLWVGIGILVLLLAILIPVGVVVSKKKGGNSDDGGGGGRGGAETTDGEAPANENLKTISENDIPTSAKGSVLDPFVWYDTTDFNVTYTTESVGGLSIMGLNSTWDDTVQANEYVPPLNKTWLYGQMPIRGVNLGGWLSIEPFITPSIFKSYKPNQGIVDEYTLCAELGPSRAAKLLEKHYARFVTEQTFQEIQAAGLDHVRIPFSYWAITTYPGDPYVPQISWRYLLRGIEWARKYGLRINLDVHALPGSQNGWNHSGRLGAIGWLNGTDGALNAQRSLDLHKQLSQFFAQPRYRNIIAIYGLVNEPKMSALDVDEVVSWTKSAVQIVRGNGIKQTIAFGDGFLGLTKWHGKLDGVDGLVLDAHQYTIFNPDQISFTHQKKIEYACSGWSELFGQSMDVSTGFGPTLCGEWSQADTDCAPYLNNIGTGSRWLGTLNTPFSPSQSIVTPSCPNSNPSSSSSSSNNPSSSSSKCTCTPANASPSTYTPAYKRWLLINAESQMHSFEKGWGWFYWTWVTEDAVQWSYRAGMEAGILPRKTWVREWKCEGGVDGGKLGFGGLEESY